MSFTTSKRAFDLGVQLLLLVPSQNSHRLHRNHTLPLLSKSSCLTLPHELKKREFRTGLCTQNQSINLD